MSGERIRSYLGETGTAFEETEHLPAVTAQQVANVEHESGWAMAKPVMLKVGGRLVMAVVPAPMFVDLRKVKSSFPREDVSLASEEEFGPLFPDCDVGAEPIFGNLYNVPVYVDERIGSTPYLVFRGGNHRKTLKVATEDFLRLVKPEVRSLGTIKA